MALITWAHDPRGTSDVVHNQRGTCIRDPIHVVLVTSVHDQVGTFDVLCISIKKKWDKTWYYRVRVLINIYLNVKFNKITSN